MAFRVRVGVVGCGQVAAVGHFPWYRRNPRVELVAAARDGRAAVDMVLAAYRSSEEGIKVRLGPPVLD